ncbi:MAG: S41 family peptidase [Sedimentisphaerales bacterium]|nr:S41 family peptidase [Sedimentisphaerales bacterium]
MNAYEMNRRTLMLVIIIVAASLLAVAFNLYHTVRMPSQRAIENVADIIKNHYVSEVNDTELINGAMRGMLHSLDPYSEYIVPQDIPQFEKYTSGNYDGIGIEIDTRGGLITVVSPFENSPAWRAGVLPGDVIVEVDGESTKGWTGAQAVEKLTGPSGTEVSIRILRRDGVDKTISIKRDKITMPTIRGWRRLNGEGGWDYLLDSETGIGYIRIIQFTMDTAKEFNHALDTLDTAGLQALIIDLRHNPGGLLDTAVEIADRFIEDGVIVSMRGAHNPEKTLDAHKKNTFRRIPTVVLINEGSASASEVVAGALQDHDRAVIIGKRSWGKGSVQRVFSLSHPEALVKLTTDYYYLPNGRCVHRINGSDTWGVEPNIEQDINVDELPALRDVMEVLFFGAALTNNETSQAQDVAENITALPPAQQAQKLLELDDQLGRAVEECRTLLNQPNEHKEETSSDQPEAANISS